MQPKQTIRVNLKTVLLCIAAFVMLTRNVAAQKIIYVDAAAKVVNNNGTSWKNAFTKLQDALAEASVDSTSEKQIWVAKGTYYPDEGKGLTDNNRSASFLLQKNLGLYGGFAGTETKLSQRDWQANQTILSGDLKQNDKPGFNNNEDNAYHVVQSKNMDSTAVLSGFTITAGNADSSGLNRQGGGMNNVHSSPTIWGCRFDLNFTAGNGGGIANIETSLPLITDCVFQGNIGGGIFNSNSLPKIQDCQFIENRSSSGGGISNFNSSPTITHSRFYNNSSTNGGGMYNSHSFPTISNCVFFRNSASFEGGGLFNFNSNPAIINCSISDNSAGFAGGGIIDTIFSSSAIYNSILWGNTSSVGAELYSADNTKPSISNSIVKGGSPGPGNLDKDPLFTNTVGAELDLQACSPAINAGDNSANNTTIDLPHHTRIVGGIIDMGAYEFQGTPLSLTTYYHDKDSDSFGDPLDTIRVCSITPPIGYVTNNTDCDDNNNLIYPGASYILYVNANAPATGSNGFTWATAFNSLQDALAKAGSCTNTKVQIWVAKGTYYPDEGDSLINDDRNARFQLKKGVAIYGGFAGTETQLSQRNWQTNITILSGDLQQDDGVNFTNNKDNAYHVVQSIASDSTGVLDGFTIKGGNANVGGTLPNDAGGGFVNYNSSCKIANCIFSENTASFGGGMYTFGVSPTLINCSFTGNKASAGGGMYNLIASPQITNCTFSANSAVDGGGLFNDNSSDPVLTNCIFINNSASSRGGGMHNSSASPKVIRSKFQGNIADFAGGGIMNIGSSPLVTNCSFFGNKAPAGGGMYNSDLISPDSTILSSPIVNSTSFAGNRANDGGGAIESRSSFTLTNSILWGNVNGEIIGILAPPIVTHSIIKGGFAGTGNIDKDPLFVDTATGDLHLQPCSPAINAGVDNNNNTTLDLDSNTRTIGIIDIGAYEFQGTPLFAPSIAKQPLNTQTLCQATQAAPLSIQATGSGITYQWYRSTSNSNSGGAAVTNATSSSFTPPTTTAGISYYYAIVKGTCDSIKSGVAEVIVRLKSITTAATANSNPICKGSSTQLILHGTTGDGAVIKWYADAAGTALVGSGNGLFVSPTVTTTYYGRFEAPAPCNIPSEMKAITVTVSQPSIAGGALASQSTICFGESSQLALQGSMGTGAVVRWYSDANGTQLVGEGNGLSVQPTSTTTYYGRFEDPVPCNTKSAMQSVTVTVLPLFTWYLDADGDGFGNPSQSTSACTKPNGYVADGTDCNDANKSIWHNGFLFRDEDEDGYTVGNGETLCYGEKTPAGYQINRSSQEDCNDNNDKIYPAKIVYVNASATSGRNNGTSWNDAFTNLQDALANAGRCGGTVQIWMAKGTYQPTTGTSREASFVLRDSMALYGGFAGTETSLQQRNWQTNQTILSGEIGTNTITDNSYHVVKSMGLDSTAALDGFVITGGYANGNSDSFDDVGGGILDTASAARYRHCTITGNSASFLGGGLYQYNSGSTFSNCIFTTNQALGGGGAFLQGTADRSPAFDSCRFTNNKATLYGGGIYNIHAAPIITRSSFITDTAYAGGGLYNNDSLTALVTNCIFSGNIAITYGGGLYNLMSSPRLTNCVFTRNTAVNLGGGMDNSSSDPTIINCSFAGNRAAKGGAMDNDGASPLLINCILWGDTAIRGSEIFTNNSTTTLTDSADVRNSLVRGGYKGSHVLTADPLFRDTAAGDLSLKPCSPAINKGIDSVNKTLFDLAGKPRLKDTIDLGAYEYQGPSCANAPLPVVFVSLSAQPQGEDVQLTWIVAGEQNIEGYAVEHSLNGRTFNRIGEALAENKGRYNYLHLQAGAGVHYYRIRSREVDGGSRYSPVVRAVIGKTAGYLVVAPNPPEGNQLNVQFNSLPQGRYVVRLINGNGQVLFNTTIQHAGGNSIYPLQLPSTLAAGLYQLQVQQPNGERLTEKLFIQ
jgi:hypothetical protein